MCVSVYLGVCLASYFLRSNTGRYFFLLGVNCGRCLLYFLLLSERQSLELATWNHLCVLYCLILSVYYLTCYYFVFLWAILFFCLCHPTCGQGDMNRSSEEKRNDTTCYLHTLMIFRVSIFSPCSFFFFAPCCLCVSLSWLLYITLMVILLDFILFLLLFFPSSSSSSSLLSPILSAF